MKTEEKKLKPPCSGFQFWQTHGRKDRVVKDFSWWLFSEVFVGVSVQVLQWSNSMSSFLNPMCSSSLGKFVAPSPPTMMYSSPSTGEIGKTWTLKVGETGENCETVSWCAFLDTLFTNSKWNSETNCISSGIVVEQDRKWSTRQQEIHSTLGSRSGFDCCQSPYGRRGRILEVGGEA